MNKEAFNPAAYSGGSDFVSVSSWELGKTLSNTAEGTWIIIGRAGTAITNKLHMEPGTYKIRIYFEAPTERTLVRIGGNTEEGIYESLLNSQEPADKDKIYSFEFEVKKNYDHVIISLQVFNTQKLVSLERIA